MLAWFWSWFKKSDERYDLFAPKQRNIYFYMVGKSVHGVEHIRDVDPMEIEKRLAGVRSDLLADLKVARSPVSPKEWIDKRYAAALEKIRLVFNVETYDKGGLLEEELFALLDHFVGFTETIKKNSRMSQTSVEETSPVILPSVAPQSPITNTLDSGSTVAEPSIVQQEPLPMEQESPSVCTPQEENTTSPLPTESPKPV